ncbi:MAG: hypothetical protein QNK37_32490 [Acidobacteriota bacterium]|nr:hypothetical protein [Acidobacteriota bacterium]
MSKKFSSTILFFLFVPISAQDECWRILMHGIHDTNIIDLNTLYLSFLQKTEKRNKSKTFELETNSAAGLEDFKTVNLALLSGNYAELENLNSEARQLLSKSLEKQSLEILKKLEIFTKRDRYLFRNANPQIVEAWKACMSYKKNYDGILFYYSSEENGQYYKLHLEWNPRFKSDPIVKNVDIFLKNASFSTVAEDKRKKIGYEIDPQEKTLILRVDESSKDAVVIIKDNRGSEKLLIIQGSEDVNIPPIPRRYIRECNILNDPKNGKFSLTFGGDLGVKGEVYLYGMVLHMESDEGIYPRPEEVRFKIGQRSLRSFYDSQIEKKISKDSRTKWIVTRWFENPDIISDDTAILILNHWDLWRGEKVASSIKVRKIELYAGVLSQQ